MHGQTLRRAFGFLVSTLILVGWVATATSQDTVRIGGTGAVTAAMALMDKAFQQSSGGVRVTVLPGLGSRGGKDALAAGAIDLAVTAGPLTPADQDQGLVVRALIKTPLVFVVSPQNPVSNVSLRELADLYRGQTLTWPDGSRVRPILRAPLDSDTRLMRSFSPTMDHAVSEALARPGMQMAATDQEAVEAVQSIPGAIGTSTLGLVSAERRPLKVLAVAGVSPSPETVVDGSYPYVKTLYFVIRTSPPSPVQRSSPVQRFIGFLSSDRGRQALGGLGFVVP